MLMKFFSWFSKIKKYLLYLIILFVVFSYKNTFAATSKIPTTQYYFYNWNDSSELTISTTRSAGVKYYGYQFNSAASQYGFEWAFNIDDLDTSTYYDLDFTIMLYGVQFSSLQNLAFFVRNNDKVFTCNVTNNVTNTVSSGSNYTFNNFYTVECNDVYIVDTSYITMGNFNTSSGTFLGISAVSFSPSDTITGAIEDNTKAIEDNTKASEEIKDSITDDSVDDSSISSIQDTDVGTEAETKIQDLITLPLKFWTSLLNASSGTCSPYSLTFLGNSFTLPCVDLEDYLGEIWNIIDLICSVVLFYNFAIKLKEIFVNFTSLQLIKEDLVQ